MITPLSKELDGLDAIVDDYDSTAIAQESNDCQEESNVEQGTEVDLNKTTKLAAEELALARLNLVVTGNDTDSVSTLGNPMTPTSLKKARMSNMISIRTSQTGTSSVTNTSIDTRMSVILSLCRLRNPARLWMTNKWIRRKEVKSFLFEK